MREQPWLVFAQGSTAMNAPQAQSRFSFPLGWRILSQTQRIRCFSIGIALRFAMPIRYHSGEIATTPQELA
jgi:hypothetical protein